MARITGKIVSDGVPAADAYVQLRDKDNDFVGETRADDDGHFVLYAVPGTWQLVAWLPAGPRCHQVLEIKTAGDIDVECSLAPVTTPTLRGSL